MLAHSSGSLDLKQNDLKTSPLRTQLLDSNNPTAAANAPAPVHRCANREICDMLTIRYNPNIQYRQ